MLWSHGIPPFPRSYPADTRRVAFCADGWRARSAGCSKQSTCRSQSIDMVPSGTLKTVDVTYKVCIDIPIESYRAAHIQISHNRWIPAFFNEMKHRPGWRVWDGGKRPPSLMFRPSGLNDMVSVSRVLFEAVLRIDFFARWIGL